MRFAKHATREDIDEVVAQHARAVRYAIDAGFDAVEIHLGHNYLASSFLSPLVNKRSDEFGGSLANRAKVARAIVTAVRREVERDGAAPIAVIAKLNMADGSAGSTSRSRCRPRAGCRTTAGWTRSNSPRAVPLVNPDVPCSAAMCRSRSSPPPSNPPLSWGMWMTGTKFLRRYPYQDAFLLKDALVFRKELTMPLIPLAGSPTARPWTSRWPMASTSSHWDGLCWQSRI